MKAPDGELIALCSGLFYLVAMETTDYVEKIKERLASLIRENPAQTVIDQQEMDERVDAAQAYAGEDEAHFVSYCNDCIDTSVKANADIRLSQKECYDTYKESAPDNYQYKEDWQSKVILPGPFTAVQTAMSAVRKAFTPSFLSIEKETDPDTADFWQKLMTNQLDKDHADFSVKFTDATGMGFAVGQSLEMIPVWREGKGLDYIMVEPWKIHRDPDAASRDPQSGMYWIHQEWLDKYLLKELEKSGKYQNVDKIGDSAGSPQDTDLTQEEIAGRKEKIFQRSTYRKAILTSEFWGVVLDKKGNMLLPRATYTVAGGSIIEVPREVPYNSLRWPGMSFSPLPDFLSYEGRGILHGIRSLWGFICSLFCLHIDNLNWVVNPMLEIDITSLVDQADIDVIPGKPWLTRGSVNGQQVVRAIERSSRTTDILQNLKYADEMFQKGVFVNDALQGRTTVREITAKEAAQNLDQAMGVFGLMGENIESGAIKIIKAGMETIEINAGYEDVSKVFGDAVAQQFIDETSDTGISLPPLSGGFSVSGLSAILKDNETMKHIQETILPLLTAQTPLGKYLKPYNILKSIETRINLKDEDMVVTQEEADQIDAQEAQAQKAMQDQQMALQQQEADQKSMLHDEKMTKLQKDKQNLDVKLLKELEPKPEPAAPQMNGKPIPRKEGGPVQPGVKYKVGEQGPEEVVFSQPGIVYPNPETVMQQNKDKNFVQRMMSPEMHPVINNPDGSISTHEMSWSEVDNGRAIAYPNIIQDAKSGKLVRLAPDQAIKHAMETKQAILFDDPRQAEHFTKNYKGKQFDRN